MSGRYRLLWLLGWAVLLGCSDASTHTTPPARKVAVNVVSVVRKPKTRVVYLLGTVEANREMKIAFKIGGKIKAIHFERGQMVNKGALLVRLDTTEMLALRAKAQENKNKAGRDLRRMEIRLANPEEKLRPGQIANVEVYLRRQDDGVFIPLDAVIGLGADPAVYVVKDYKAQRRRIQTGAVIGQAVEVLSGLLAGDQLVVSGQEYLKDRQPVVITEKLAELR